MDEDKPKLGFEVAQELHDEFVKLGTAGYAIRISCEATGQVFSIVGYKTEQVTDPMDAAFPNKYQTWIMVEEND